MTPPPSLLPLQLATSFGLQPMTSCIECALPLCHEALIAGRWHLSNCTQVDETWVPIFLAICTLDQFLVNQLQFHLDYLISPISGIPTLVIVITRVIAELVRRLQVGMSHCGLPFGGGFGMGWCQVLLNFGLGAAGLIRSPFALCCCQRRSGGQIVLRQQEVWWGMWW